MQQVLKNGINYINSKYIKLPFGQFINLSYDEYNNIKCKSCNSIPLIPIVIKNDESKINSDYEILCKECYSNLKDNDENISIKNIDKQYSSTIKIIIQNMQIKCINENIGCKWIGELSNFESHLNDECLYQKIKCPNKECDKIIYKKDLSSHLIKCDYIKKIMKVRCNYCGGEFDLDNLVKHIKECPELIIECDNGCGEKIKKKDLEEHKTKKCPEQLNKCHYWDKGCKKKIKRKYLEDHYILEKDNHLNLDKENYGRNNNYYGIDNKSIENRKIAEKEMKKEDNHFHNNENYQINYNKNINDEIKNHQNYNYFLMNDNNYFSFPMNRLKFITKEENIKKKLFEFQKGKIIYKGDISNIYYKYVSYPIFSENAIDLDYENILSFKINMQSNEINKNDLQLIVFGLYISSESNKFDINNITFPNEYFYGIDSDNYTYKLNQKAPNREKINLNGPITITYLPDKEYFLIKDSFNFTLKFNYGFRGNKKIDKKSEVRYFFVFKGKFEISIEYNFVINK